MTAPNRRGRWWNVREAAEEFACPFCGQPVQADRPEPGEPDFSRAWSDDEMRESYCSPKCAARAEAGRDEDEREDARHEGNAVHP